MEPNFFFFWAEGGNEGLQKEVFPRFTLSVSYLHVSQKKTPPDSTHGSHWSAALWACMFPSNPPRLQLITSNCLSEHCGVYRKETWPTAGHTSCQPRLSEPLRLFQHAKHKLHPIQAGPVKKNKWATSKLEADHKSYRTEQTITNFNTLAVSLVWF